MTAFPWYLGSAGILIVILGVFMADLQKPSETRPRRLREDMDDEEIVRALRTEQRVSAAGLVILVGLLCLLVSAVWKLVRVFVG